ncbi:peptidase inhibitor family I36 protein [Microbacterium maritypicum]
MNHRVVAIAAIILLTLSGATSAQASEVGLHPDVEYALEAVPGGEVVDPYTVVWPELGMELTVPNPRARSVGSCATGTFCAYSEADGNGTRLSFGVCTTVSTSALTIVRSVANARASGNVQARTGTGAVVATVVAGTRLNVPSTVRSLRCSL